MERVFTDPPGQVVVPVDYGMGAQHAKRARHVRVRRGLLSDKRSGRGCGQGENGE
jgi:hypothetical protein